MEPPGLEPPVHLCALENHSTGSRERGPVLIPLRQTALYAAQARTCLRCTSALTLDLPWASRPSATWHTRRGRKPLIPLLSRLCPHLGASLRVRVLVLVTLWVPLPFDPVSLTAVSSQSISSHRKEAPPRAH